MSYTLKPGRPVAKEVARNVSKQLALALDGLRGVGGPGSHNATREVRRHVKKVRAVLRLVQSTLGETYDTADRRLRKANRLLAPVADAGAVIEALDRFGNGRGARPSRRALSSMRGALVKRAARLERKARRDRVVQTVAGILRAEQRKVTRWPLSAGGVRAIASGFEESVRRARKAMTRATRRPTSENYHAWRRAAKTLWLHVRLVERRCGNGLGADRRRLEALDDCLGVYHDVVLLENILVAEGMVSRGQTAAWLRAFRQRQKALRRRAAVLGRADGKPSRFARRVKRLWLTEKRLR